jgi:nucleoside-diphosphate-sugar epimerase
LRALVTGGGGFVGRYLVAELQRRGDSVSVLSRPGSRSAEGLEQRGVGIVSADLRRPGAELREALGDSDAVYHLAAGVGPGWRATFESNVTATENLIDAIEQSGWRGRFVHVSSFAVYGVNQLRPGTVLDEETPLEPEPGRRDDYAWTKLIQERIVRERLGALDGVELAVVRPGAIYGPERRFQYRLGRELGTHAILLLGGGNTMPLTFVENTASLIAECGRSAAAAGGVFNAVDPEPITQRRYLRAWRQADPALRVVPFPLWAYRAIGRVLRALSRPTGGRVEAPLFLDPYVMEPSLRRMRYDSSRARSVLGWEPPVPAEEALRRTFSSKSSS